MEDKKYFGYMRVSSREQNEGSIVGNGCAGGKYLYG